jgi:3-hydroxymyristoyl/3-hydroxydecanoyl-(acyl carrier protein) dehydratase
MGSADFVVERIEAGAGRARLRAEVPLDLVFFEGHFEGRPMLPGIAQLLALVHRRARELFPGLGDEKRLVRLKFEATIVPGDVLEVLLERADAAEESTVRFEIRRGEVRCASGGIVYARA